MDINILVGIIIGLAVAYVLFRFLNKKTVGSFRALKQELETHKKVTETLAVTADGLKRVLSNNQLRGQFGEQVAEDLLKMTGFVKGVDYETNKKQKDSKTKPDF